MRSYVPKASLWGAIVVAGVTASSAVAQTTADTNRPATPALEEVVVTGSRILRRDLISASPLVTIGSENLADSAQVGIETQLNKLPQFSGGNNQFSGAADVQASPTNSPGAATVNLRGLGSNRTLVLVDGRRAQPFNASLAIDLNSIPAAALESVEVITGGAAAVYGADAVAGVVNFKLKHNFTGAEFDGQWGETQAGDGRQLQGSILLGSNLADDRGNVMIGVSYAKRDPVYQVDRSFYRAAFTDPFTNADIFLPIPQFSITDTSGFVTNAPSQGAVDCVFAGVGVGCPFAAKTFSNGQAVAAGEITGGAGGANLYGVNADGTVFDPGRSASSRAVGYNGPLYPNYKILGTAGNSNNGLVHNNTTALASLPLDRYSLFANGAFDINDRVTAYAEGTFTQSRTTSVSNYTPASIAWSATIPYNSDPTAIDPATVGFGNATLPQYVTLGCPALGGCTFGQDHPVPPQLAYLLNARTNPNAPWDLNMELPWMGPTTIRNTTDTYQVTAGFRGRFPQMGLAKDWTWEAYASHGSTDIVTDYTSGFVNTTAYQTLIAQPFFGAGYSNNNNFLGRAATCTSGLPVFTQFTPSADCTSIVAARMKGTTSIVQDVFESYVQGGLFTLPAGQVRGVLGADYRHDGFEFKPDPTMTASNILSAASGVFDVAPASGATWVKELYGELLIPALQDLPAIKRLELELGARISSYNTAGTVKTYKALTTWQTGHWLTLRGGYQLANRAPNVAELFESPTTIVTIEPTFDPCSSITTAPYGNVAANPHRAQVQALCSALSGGVPIGNNFIGLGQFSATALDTQIGNPNLKSESATTWTAGAVLRPGSDAELLRRLSATIDWYRIQIENAITGLTTSSVYEQCLNGDSTNPNYDPNNAFCKLIHRDNIFGFPAGVNGLFTNIGAIRTSGLDLQANWAAQLRDMHLPLPGQLSVDVAANYLFSYDVQSSSGAPFLDYAGLTGNSVAGPQYRWKLYTTLGYAVGPVSTRLAWRHLPSLPNIVPGAVPNAAYNELDFYAVWSVADQVTLRAGVENLANAQPPIVGRIPGVSNNYGTTDPTYYDVLGRRFFFGFTARF
jgi:iron complex outermembrane receptor protein